MPITFCYLFISLSVLYVLAEGVTFCVLLFDLTTLLVFVGEHIIASFLVLTLILSRVLVPGVIFPILRITPSKIRRIVTIPLRRDTKVLVRRKSRVGGTTEGRVLTICSYSIKRVGSGVSLRDTSSVGSGYFGHGSDGASLVGFLGD